MLLIWLPLSWVYVGHAYLPLIGSDVSLIGYRGEPLISWYAPRPASWSSDFSYGVMHANAFVLNGGRFATHPPANRIHWVDGARIEVLRSVPLWLLAAVCLAWPVTSFIVARRRRKGRGFEVEAASGAPEVRQEPEPGASPRVGDGDSNLKP